MFCSTQIGRFGQKSVHVKAGNCAHIGVVGMLELELAIDVSDAWAVKKCIHQVRREGLVRAVGGKAHGLAEQHGGVVCATEGGKSALCTYMLGVWGPAREHVCAPARMPLTISCKRNAGGR